MLLPLPLRTPPLRSGGRYLRFIPRNEMDIAEASAGVCVTLEASGAIAVARVAVGAVAPTPLFVREAGESLVGATPPHQALARAAEISPPAAPPLTGMRRSAPHSQRLGAVP